MRHVCALFLAAASLFAQGSLGELSSQFQSLVQRTGSAVVQVVVRSYAASGDDSPALIRSAKGNGSGTIVSADGYIITNAHVVANARVIQVLLPITAQEAQTRRSILKTSGKLIEAKLVGQDRETDIAVLKIDQASLPFVPFGDSEALHQGHMVFAFGSPLGLENSVTMGIVSSVARQVRPDDPMIYIQTDAAINPGNSGGALVDAEGRLVGINTAILSRTGGNQGVGFAVPSNIVKRVADKLIKDGKIQHAYLGIAGGTLSIELNQALGLDDNFRGVLVQDVPKDGPAGSAGIRIGTKTKEIDGESLIVDSDIIVGVDDVKVNRFEDLLGYLFLKTEPGQTITLKVYREGKTIDVSVKLGVRPTA